MLLLLFGTLIPIAIAAPNVHQGYINERLTIIQNNSLVGVSTPHITTAKDIALELLLQEIIKRESGGNAEVCNAEFGCGSGMGLCGFISSTWNSTLKRMKKEDIIMDNYCWQLVDASANKNHPIFNKECHMTVCRWLLLSDGIRHWDSNGGEWGSGPYNLLKYNLKND